MHVMDGECEKSGECLAAEGAPELINDKVAGDSAPDGQKPKSPEKATVNGDHAHESDDIEAEISAGAQSDTSVESLPEQTPDSPERLGAPQVSQEKPDEAPKEALEVVKEPEKAPIENGEVPERVEVGEKPPEPVIKSEKEDGILVSDEDDRNSVSSSHVSQSETERRKRSVERDGEVSSGSESESGKKRIKREPDTITPEPSLESQAMVEDDRERVIREFVEGCSRNVTELSSSIDKLQKEVSLLGEIARAREIEWNSILRIRKLKEEMLERLLRKKRQHLVLQEGTSNDWSSTIEAVTPRNSKCSSGNNQLMMVPIVSSSPGGGPGVNSRAVVSSSNTVRVPEIARQPRPILPKPFNHNLLDPNNSIREGRNGPIVDVKSIIADYSSGYRSRHPENVPRRGRRVRTEGPMVNRLTSSPALISMANMALGSGASVRTDPTYSMTQDHLRTTDSCRTSQQTESGVSYKDVLVQFAKLSQGPNHTNKAPPPYPEVTLHPVTASPQSPPTSHSSLLHGILTKPTSAPPAHSNIHPPPAAHRPTTFSPTLARLLTAPDRPSPSHNVAPSHVSSPYRQTANSRVSISDLLTSSKDDDDENESGDRLVIDEGGDGANGSEDVPQCQGCRQKPAQFVCAGCGNQWYCSRECQVAAWEEHSDVCSG